MADDLDRWEPEKKLVDALSPRLGAIVRYLDARSQRRTEQVLDEAAAAAGTDVDELLRQIESDERLLLLLAMTVEAAQRASAEAKLTGLGRALANGVLHADDAAIDESQMVVTTLRDVEPPHLRALLAIERRGDPSMYTAPVSDHLAESAPGGLRTKPGAPSPVAAIGQILHGNDRLAYPIIATLLRHGLIYELEAQAVGGLPTRGDWYWATDYGRYLLELLDAGRVEVPAEQATDGSDGSDGAE